MISGIRSTLIPLILLIVPGGCANLIEDVQHGDVKAVKSRLEGGVDVHKKDDIGYTALMYAAEGGNVELIRMLLDHGADPNVKAKDGRTPLISAARNGHTMAALELIDRGADIHEPWFGRSPTLWAIEGRGVDIVLALLEHGAEVNEKNVNGITPLMCAAEEGDTNMVKMLLEKGAKPHVRDDKGNTALSYARYFKRRLKIDVVKDYLRYHVGVTTIQLYDPKTNALVDSQTTYSPEEVIIRAIMNGLVIRTDSPGIRRTLEHGEKTAAERSAELLEMLGGTSR